MKIYNTLTRKKEEFVPAQPGVVNMYVCGPTVYNYFHIGNARPFVVFDTMRKYLEFSGNKVNFVQNFTDVDDKIINKAREEGVSAPEISERFIKEYYRDAAAINVKKATVHPKVSETMDDIIKFVKELEDKGYAYEVDGDVYFSTRKFQGYGKLSRQNIDDLESGARIMIEERKKTRWISRSGRPEKSRTRSPGNRRGEWDARDGTSNARPCPGSIWVIP